ncbi:MAG: hypothetical protein ACLSTO_05485 [Bilophila wadsworthia]
MSPIALDEEKLPLNLPIVIFRIIQKPSATRQHSGRPRRFGMDGDALRLVISDDGKAGRGKLADEREVRPWPQEPPRACTAQPVS